MNENRNCVIKYVKNYSNTKSDAAKIWYSINLQIK